MIQGWRGICSRLVQPLVRWPRVLRLTDQARPQEGVGSGPSPRVCGGVAGPETEQADAPPASAHFPIHDFSAAARAAGLTQLWLDLPWWQVRPRVLLELAREGWRWSWLGRGHIVLGLPTRLVAYLRGAAIVWTRLCRRLGWEREPFTAEAAAEWLKSTRSQGGERPPAEPASRRILHCLKTCLRGGVERQAAYLAAAQVRSGAEVRVVYLFPSLAEPDTAHDWFAEAGVHPRLMPEAGTEQVPAGGAFRPDVLHAWVDDANVAALAAGCLAGVPRIHMTVLGLSPGRCPQVRTPWMRPLYQAGLKRDNVRLICISNFGVADYAEWLGVDRERLTRIRIGIPLPQPLSAAERRDYRRRLGVPDGGRLVGGLFRLEPDKRPLLFARVVGEVMKRRPTVHGLHIGGGSLAQPFAAEIRRLHMASRFHVLGRVADALTPLAACDLLLLASAAEGTPTVALEAQALGVVPVLADVGACRETVVDGQTGLIVPAQDEAAMVAAIEGLLNDPDRLARMAAKGREFVESEYGLERFVRAGAE
ncbi:MAG TPA: glycosyltransferase [Gemmatales bacterium]|nr:glycosyltransferase [Gemmatales bacterium]